MLVEVGPRLAWVSPRGAPFAPSGRFGSAVPDPEGQAPGRSARPATAASPRRAPARPIHPASRTHSLANPRAAPRPAASTKDVRSVCIGSDGVPVGAAATWAPRLDAAAGTRARSVARKRAARRRGRRRSARALAVWHRRTRVLQTCAGVGGPSAGASRSPLTTSATQVQIAATTRDTPTYLPSELSSLPSLP